MQNLSPVCENLLSTTSSHGVMVARVNEARDGCVYLMYFVCILPATSSAVYLRQLKLTQ